MGQHGLRLPSTQAVAAPSDRTTADHIEAVQVMSPPAVSSSLSQSSLNLTWLENNALHETDSANQMDADQESEVCVASWLTRPHILMAMQESDTDMVFDEENGTIVAVDKGKVSSYGTSHMCRGPVLMHTM